MQDGHGRVLTAFALDTTYISMARGFAYLTAVVGRTLNRVTVRFVLR